MSTFIKWFGFITCQVSPARCKLHGWHLSFHSIADKQLSFDVGLLDSLEEKSIQRYPGCSQEEGGRAEPSLTSLSGCSHLASVCPWVQG